MVRYKKQEPRDPESWDYRECAGCGWKTTKGAKFQRDCKKCGSAAMLKKQHTVEQKKKKARKRKKIKSCEGQMTLFDKTKNATEET